MNQVDPTNLHFQKIIIIIWGWNVKNETHIGHQDSDASPVFLWSYLFLEQSIPLPEIDTCIKQYHPRLWTNYFQFYKNKHKGFNWNL